MAKSDVSAVNHLLPTVNEGFISTLGSTIAGGASSAPLTDITGLVNGSTFIGIIEPGTNNQQVFTGQVDTTGSQITNVKWTRGDDVSHSGGSTIVDYITGTAINMFSKWAAVEHYDDGHHSAINADSVVTASLTVGGKDVSQLTPTGLINPFAGATAPAGWLLCDGSEISRTTYASLFAVIGITYGSASGTTFTLPNAKGKILAGRDTAQTEFAALGQTGGEKTHVLIASEMPSHGHGVNDSSHQHRMWTIGQEGNVYTLGGTSNRAVLNGGNPEAGNGFTGHSTTGISIQAAGGDAPHNNLQPYLTTNYIIKT